MLKNGEAGDVATRPGKTCDKAVTDRIGDLHEDNRNGFSLPIRRGQNRRRARHDHIRAERGQFSRYGTVLFRIDGSAVSVSLIGSTGLACAPLVADVFDFSRGALEKFIEVLALLNSISYRRGIVR